MHEDCEEVAALWQQLRRFPSRPALWLALVRWYVARGLVAQAGYAARQACRMDPSLLAQLQALELGPWQDPLAADAWLGRVAPADASALAQRFSDSLAQYPGDWLTWLYLARMQDILQPQKLADTESAGHELAQAQSLEPMAGESLHWLGVWRLSAEDAPGAIAAFSRLLDIRPVRFGSMMYLGEALLRVGHVVAAQKAFARASLSPNPDFLQTLAARVYAHNYWQEAITVLNKALDLRANSVPILLALAKIQSEVYALADCRESLRRIHALSPDQPEARLLAAGLQGRMGDAKGHLLTLQSALAAGADPLSRLASSVAMTALYHDAMSSTEVADLHRSLCAPIEAAVQAQTVFAMPRSPGEGLRIGYVTGDLHRQHPVNIFMLPVLMRHDRTRFKIHVYHTGTMHDEYTRQAQACADHWREAATLDDAALHRTIVADGIDILIDLAGHTASHRLGVFAMRAAPVQATFLGYPHSTGMSRMDWLIGDATVSPAEHGHLFSEGIAQLPDSVFCWAPVDDHPLPAPRGSDAPLVFGSFNNAMKLSPKTIALWSRVLHALPASQLLLKAPSLRDEAVQSRFIDRFAEHGIGPERLRLRGPSGLAEMMQEYGDMDIALDPTPYNGGTTTLQALWMGVPVVCLSGDNFVSRMGVSFLRTLGQPTWIAEDSDAYVSAAVELARQVGSLRSGRVALRSQMSTCALCDIEAYVLHFQALLERMWTQHCIGGGRVLLAAMPAHA
jgi:predicted O-linked N-acetylglucosamine transferase (SPINDLY family)